MNNATPRIVCYGEVLWDIFPTGKKAGGAPFNVSYNLKKMGVDSHMVSKVGNDELGSQLLGRVAAWGIPTIDCQLDDHFETGTVLAHIDEHNEAHYEIKTNAAWDHIEYTEHNSALVASADAFVFGSLSGRSATSRDTLFRLLDVAKFKVFDINLRPPFYTKELLDTLMRKANLIKCNKAELREIVALHNKEYISEPDSLRFIEDTFGVHEILLTKGSKGAVYYGNGTTTLYPAIPVAINDTVGSGDSFLAGYLAARFQGKTNEEAVRNATALGAFITTQSGACPEYSLAQFEEFKHNHTPAYTTN
ncbi:MAG: carbohydrate kinase [Edaphocola sp.]